METTSAWRHCGTCKKDIDFKARYYACAVSSCKNAAYCSMECFDAHVPIFRHREGWAENRTAPSREQADANSVALSQRRVVGQGASNSVAQAQSAELPQDVLIVASKLKDYISARSGGMSTSATVLKRLSDMVRIASDKAIEQARREGRKTVMDRDFTF